MAKIQVLTKSSRGKAICSKCGKEILSHEKYLKATPYRKEPIIRCLMCGLKDYETSGSKYLRSIGELKYDWKRKYLIHDTVIDDIITKLEIIKDDIEDNLYNLPEQFQSESVLQERLDAIEDCIDDLESIDLQENDKENITCEIEMALSNLLLK